MIRYDLCCESGHGFEGWFRDSSAFEGQQEAGHLACPQCGTASVMRALMAPAVVKRGGEQRPDDGAGVPDVMMAALQKLRRAVETGCEDMGDAFAREALKIEAGEAERRGIYGRMTDAERDMLDEAGVDFVSVPWVRRADG